MHSDVFWFYFMTQILHWTFMLEFVIAQNLKNHWNSNDKLKE